MNTYQANVRFFDKKSAASVFPQENYRAAKIIIEAESAKHVKAILENYGITITRNQVGTLNIRKLPTELTEDQAREWAHHGTIDGKTVKPSDELAKALLPHIKLAGVGEAITIRNGEEA